ncbi:hypothetical protein CPB86DRAFT_815560 [Serendipita vermifera]|nr:hypothetical protein CPB86DRAFT_815560 [Serendipita vermifera]
MEVSSTTKVMAHFPRYSVILDKPLLDDYIPELLGRFVVRCDDPSAAYAPKQYQSITPLGIQLGRPNESKLSRLVDISSSKDSWEARIAYMMVGSLVKKARAVTFTTERMHEYQLRPYDEALYNIVEHCRQELKELLIRNDNGSVFRSQKLYMITGFTTMLNCKVEAFYRTGDMVDFGGTIPIRDILTVTTGVPLPSGIDPNLRMVQDAEKTVQFTATRRGEQVTIVEYVEVDNHMIFKGRVLHKPRAPLRSMGVNIRAAPIDAETDSEDDLPVYNSIPLEDGTELWYKTCSDED